MLTAILAACLFVQLFRAWTLWHVHQHRARIAEIGLHPIVCALEIGTLLAAAAWYALDLRLSLGFDGWTAEMLVAIVPAIYSGLGLASALVALAVYTDWPPWRRRG